MKTEQNNGVEIVQPEIMPGVSLIDALAEIANIGAGNSSTRLEKALKEKISKNLMGNSIEITPQLIEYCHLSNIELRFPLTTNTGFYSLLNIGDSSAMLSIFFSMESALFIAGLVEGKEKHFEILREEDEAILRKIAEEVIDSYIESTSTFLNIPIVHTQAKKVYLKPNSIPDFVKESIGEEGDIALLFKTSFSVKKTSFKGEMKIMFSLTDLEPIINSIRKNLGMDVVANDRKDIPEFRLYDGGRIKSIDELRRSLHSMHEFTFLHHVTPFRNDFAAWIYDVFDEKNLALKMGGEKTQAGMIRIVEEFLQDGRIHH